MNHFLPCSDSPPCLIPRSFKKKIARHTMADLDRRWVAVTAGEEGHSAWNQSPVQSTYLIGYEKWSSRNCLWPKKFCM